MVFENNQKYKKTKHDATRSIEKIKPTQRLILLLL